eukprot:3814854-Pleurochrysis_carterae.AAC.1
MHVRKLLYFKVRFPLRTAHSGDAIISTPECKALSGTQSRPPRPYSTIRLLGASSDLRPDLVHTSPWSIQSPVEAYRHRGSAQCVHCGFSSSAVRVHALARLIDCNDMMLTIRWLCPLFAPMYLSPAIDLLGSRT